MSDFFKKALGVFVEFDEQPDAKQQASTKNGPPSLPGSPPRPMSAPAPVAATYSGSLSPQEIEKFNAHFNELFDKSNFPGPDYYEFVKMMHMLETPIPDENVRISAVYATLAIQGLTKDKIIDTAKQYLGILDNDKAYFEKAANDKAAIELETRKSKMASLEQKIADNSAAIQKLTKEIADAQNLIGTLKTEMVTQESKISISRNGYMAAYQAMHNTISNDIQKINAVLK